MNVFVAIVLDSYCREVEHVDEVPVEYTLFWDMWLMLLDTWKFRWSNGKKWALAHMLSIAMVKCNAQNITSEECLLSMLGELHPQVTVQAPNLFITILCLAPSHSRRMNY